MLRRKKKEYERNDDHEMADFDIYCQNYLALLRIFLHSQ